MWIWRVQGFREAAIGMNVVKGFEFVAQLGGVCEKPGLILQVGFSVIPDLIRGFPP